VRKRQPRTAQLLPSERRRIEKTPGDIEMRFRIAPIVRPAMREEKPHGEGADQRRRGRR
jgi:hypothetical protein